MKRLIIFLTGLLMMLAFIGCGRQEERPDGKEYNIYFLNDKATKVISESYFSETEEASALAEELLTQLRKEADKKQYETVESQGFSILDLVVSDGVVIINVDERYREVDNIRSILCRAALARTFTQIEGVQAVSMTVNGEALTDAGGNVIGLMQADLFIDNAGDEITPVETVSLTIYFANETGDGLKTVTRSLEYNSNISMEKLVIEQIIAGPSEEGGAPTINPDTKLISATTKDGICYVNFDAAFLTQIYEVSPEVAIYSIVNSLVELSNINKVQFSVEGETNIMYREKMNFASVFERNLDLVSK